MFNAVRLPLFTVTLVFLLIGAFALLAGCSSGSNPVSTPIPPSGSQARNLAVRVDSRLVAATNNFAFQLNQQLLAQGGQANVFFSPASVEMALALIANGAQGQTASDIAATLGTQALGQDTVNSQNAHLLAILQNPDKNVTLNIANGVWANKGYSYNANFIQSVQSYGANPQYLTLGPSSVTPINAWIATQTAQMIPNLFSAGDIPLGAALVFANAIYFKGSWSTAFNPANTVTGTFTRGDGSTESLPFMNETAQFSLLDKPHYQGVELPYSNKYVSMLAIEPKTGYALSDILPELTGANWTQLQTAESPAQVTVQLPRFSASFSSSLINPLTAMGMGSAFNPLQGFTGILSSAQPVVLSVLKHKAVLHVDETGTTAAAATGGVAIPTAIFEPQAVLRFDHPFVVIIHDNPTGAILFMGEIGDPQ